MLLRLLIQKLQEEWRERERGAGREPGTGQPKNTKHSWWCPFYSNWAPTETFCMHFYRLDQGTGLPPAFMCLPLLHRSGKTLLPPLSDAKWGGIRDLSFPPAELGTTPSSVPRQCWLGWVGRCPLISCPEEMICMPVPTMIVSVTSQVESWASTQRERDRKRRCKRKESMSFFPPILESVGPIEE